MGHSRVAIVAVLMTAALVGLAARKGATHSGAIQDNIFTDATYHYQLTLSDDWKASVFDSDSPMRLLLVHKTLMAGTAAGDGMSMKNVPGSETPVKVGFWVVTDSAIGKGLVDSILSSSYKSSLKDRILASPEGFWQIAGFERTAGGTRKLAKFGGKDGVVWAGGFVYKSPSISHVAMGIGLIGVHCDKYELLGLMYCEPKILDSAMAATAKVMQSLKVE